MMTSRHFVTSWCLVRSGVNDGPYPVHVDADPIVRTCGLLKSDYTYMPTQIKRTRLPP